MSVDSEVDMTVKEASILIVDDDSHFRETLTDALSLRKLEVHSVTSGAEALKILETMTPSVMLLDVQLPDIHGFELCRILKRSQRLKNVPVVFLSARYTEPADRVEGLIAGADAYLSKPIGLEALWDEVRYLLDKSA
ncbi:MAG: response regulator [Elusimicrobia bacterium]|nr:response regulator [Elusimicrobiota bacterium]